MNARADRTEGRNSRWAWTSLPAVAAQGALRWCCQHSGIWHVRNTFTLHHTLSQMPKCHFVRGLSPAQPAARPTLSSELCLAKQSKPTHTCTIATLLDMTAFFFLNSLTWIGPVPKYEILFIFCMFVLRKNLPWSPVNCMFLWVLLLLVWQPHGFICWTCIRSLAVLIFLVICSKTRTFGWKSFCSILMRLEMKWNFENTKIKFYLDFKVTLSYRNWLT